MLTTKETTAILDGERNAPLPTNGAGAGVAKWCEELRTLEFQPDFARIAQRLRERLDADYSIFAPRETEGGTPGIDNWLERYNDRFIKHLPEAFFEQHPTWRGKYHGEASDLAGLLLPMVQEDLRRYALRRLAIRWSAKQYPDSTGVGEPERQGANFVIPVVALRDNRPVGRIIVSESGTVSAEESTPRLEVRKALANGA